ncbi:MAG TPA: hypothetical protein VKR31_10575 [Rhizomicrobium sp.]|nr:hypothetical protein [Rhizomicrobium sp.]
MFDWTRGLGIGCIVFAICDLGMHVHLPLLDQMMIAGALVAAIVSLSNRISQFPAAVAQHDPEPSSDRTMRP